ncbi:hypothetical protein BC834DRAFT_826093 [Gloeopeniophorella convolvens]|nr:hypothetical protein BC834DRAFT_826093 [Gloeopeniophorella convolvens]
MVSVITLRADEHPIKSVTVFKSGKAEIVRIFNISLQPDQSKVQIRRLPSSIETESTRVTGLGDAQLFDLVCSVGRGIEEVDPESPVEVVRKLNAKKDVLTKDLNSLDAISNIMEQYSRSLIGDAVSPRKADAHFERLLAKSREISSTRAALKEEVLQLSRQIDVLASAEVNKQGEADGEVVVVILAKQVTTVELKLTYIVRNATWSPAYELHATTDAGIPVPSVSLNYRARITQSTGEDWTDVALTLSTGDTNLMNRSIPTLTPTKIGHPIPAPYPGFSRHSSGPRPDRLGQLRGPKPALQHGAAYGAFGEPQPPFSDKSRAAAPQPGAAASPKVFGDPLGAGGDRSSAASSMPFYSLSYSHTEQAVVPPPGQPQIVRVPSPIPHSDEFDVGVVPEEAVPFAEPTSVVRESSLAATYHVEGASGIPSDGVPHKVSVAVLPFDATIAHVAVPKAQPAAYLEARVTNTSDYRFLPGPVRAFVDDSFVSETMLEDVAPSEAFRCALGVDPAAQVRYARTAARAARTLPSPFGKQWATTACASRTTVANRHPFALRAFVLRDCVPTPDDEKRVSVVLRRPAGLADLEQGKDLEVDVDGKKKTVRWSELVEGKGGKKDGLFEWALEVGAGEEVTMEAEWDVKAPASFIWAEHE